MAAPASPESYKEVILFLATAGVVVPLFLRLKISPVLGFLGAGVLLGPLGLGRFVGEAPWLSWITIGNRQEIAHLAEFGVVFLLFMIGIELSWERLWTLRRLVFGLGSLQVVACAAVLGAIAFALGAEPAPAAFVGVALALSSTAIVVPVLAAQKRLASPTGRATFSVLLFQDLAVAPVLFTIGVLGTRQSGGLGMAFILALAQAAAAIVVIVTVGRLVLRPLFGLVAATKSTELFMALSLLVVLATGLVAAASGLSMALGAFIAGLLLAETEYRRAIEAMIDPFKGLLLGVFFVSVGMALDVTQLARNPGTILLGVVGLIGVKAVVIARARRRLPPRPPGRARECAPARPGRRVRVRDPRRRGRRRARARADRAVRAHRRDGVDDRHPGPRAHRAQPSPAARIAPRRGPGRAAAGAREGPRDRRRIRTRRPDGRRDAGAP